PLLLSFDKDIDPATFNEGTVLLVDQNGLAVPGKTSVSGSKCTFTPNKTFEEGKKYAFYAKSGQSGIKSKTGEKLIGNIIWKFECEKVAEEPKLEVAEKSFDLGEISTTIIKKLAFKNTGTGKLSATIKSSESWLRSENSEFEIEPGGSFETTATVDPLGLEPGPYSGKLSIESNGGNLEIAVGFTYKKSGMILKVEPSELDFGKIPKNTKKSLQIEIIEQAGEGGMIEGTVTASVPWIKVDPSSFKCDRCKISITVEPSTEGALTGEVTIDSNAGKIVVPVKVMVESAALLDLSVNGFSGTPLKTTSPSYTIPISTTKGATVMVGGKPATVDQNGKANYSVTLIPGLNRFEISATLGSQNKKITVDLIYAVTIELWLDKTDITINGLKVTLKTAPTSSSPPLPKELGGSTYMPIREVAEALGAQVGYDGAEKKVTLTQSLWNGKNVVELWIGKKTAKINGKEVFIDSKAQKLYPTIISAKTMLPLRFVGEALGAGVAWEGATRKITLTYPK
ncbi:MAG TPA: stalk domain-containing protein, partial [Caldisericia bacterium]|nr:stalk domain-containing protein [Caldisericia bacterium]